MNHDAFEYKIYIDTTPKRLWRALTDPAKTHKWWNTSLVTDWRAGSAMDWKMGALTVRDAEQVVLASTSPVHLSYTWHTFSPEWASAHDFSEEDRLKFANEPRSKVTFDIEKLNGVVRLTVVHDGFATGSAVHEAVREGWPPLLSSLKTYLETGEAFDMPLERRSKPRKSSDLE